MLALLDLGELGAKHGFAVFEVLEVASLYLRGDDDARRQVGQPHGGGRLVDLLAARTGRAVHVHFDLVVAQLDLAVVLGDLGHDLHGGKARMAAPGSVVG